MTFSGLAVAIGLSGLLLFEPAALRSFGIGGALVVASSVLYALTFLPATLGMLGPRVNSLGTAALRDRVRRMLGRPEGVAADAARESRWEKMAHWVMARPVMVLIPTLLFLLFLGTPFLRLTQGIPDASVLPAGIESREASVALADDFRKGETTPIVILATVAGSPTDAANVQKILDYAKAVDAVAGVDRVEGPFAGLKDPRTGADLDAAGIAALFAAPRDQLPPELAAGLDQLEKTYIRGDTVRLDAISPLSPVSPAGTAVIPAVRGIAVDGVTAQVGGLAAQGKDFMLSQSATIPWAIALTLGASALILFLLFGSVVIPIKAVADDAALDHRLVRRARLHLPGRQLLEHPRLPVARVHDRRQPDHHVQRAVRAVDGLRGPAAVPDAGGLPPDRRQHRVGRRGPGEDRRRHHRRGADHGLGLLGLRPGRLDHDQEHRRGHGDRGPHRRDDRPDPARAGDDAAARQVELVGARAARAVRRPARASATPRTSRTWRRGAAATASPAGSAGLPATPSVP